MQRFRDSFRPHLDLLRGMAWILLGEVSSKVALLVSTFASARLLSPSDFAIYSGFLAIVLTAAAVGDAGISQLLTREISGGRVGTWQSLRRVVGLKAALLPVWAVTFAVSTVLLLSSQAIDMEVIAGYAFASLLVVIQLPLVGALRGRMQFRNVASSQAIGRWVTAALLLAMMFVSIDGTDSAKAVMFATVIGELLIAGLAWMYLRIGTEREEHADVGHLSLRKALPFAANTVLSLVYNRMDIVIVAALTTATQLNKYAPASRIQDAAYVLPTAVTTVAFPLFSQLFTSQDAKAGERAQSRFLLVVGLGVTIPAILILTIFAPQFIRIILGEDFLGSVTATRILVWSIPFSVVNAALLARLTAGPRPALSTWVFMTAFVTSLGLQVILVPRMGAEGAAIASFAREPFAMLTAIFLLRRESRNGGNVPIRAGLVESSK